MDTGLLDAVALGTHALATTESYADRIRVPLPFAALRAAALRELGTFVEVLPSVRLRETELAAFRAGLDAGEEKALDGLLEHKEDPGTFVDFLFLVRAGVYEALAGRSTLTQTESDDMITGISK